MKKGFCLFCAFLLPVLYCIPVHGESLVIYDNFSSPLINPDKWMGEEANSGKILRDSFRQISRKALDMKIVGYSNTDSDTGSEIGTNSVIHTNGELVTDFMTTLTVKQFSVSACESNASGNFARARITAPLFNVGTPVPDSSVDDIYAQYRVIGAPEVSDTLKVVAFVQRCLDDGCSSTQELFKKQVCTIGVAEPIKLRIKWNSANNTIVFYHAKESEDMQSDVYKYTFDDSVLAGVAWRKRLDVSMGLGNCTDTPRPSAMIEAVFDNVYVNESAALKP